MGKRNIIIIASALGVVVVIALLVFLPGSMHQPKTKVTDQVDSVKETTRYGITLSDYLVIDSVIPNGSNFGGMMTSLGVPPDVLNAMVQQCDSVFDLRKLRAGNACTFICEKNGDKPLRWFIYHTDLVNYVKFDFGTPLKVTTGALRVDTLPHRYSGIISTSLWNAMVDDGKDPELILDLSDIFAWVIDFYGIQKGDKFKVVYDELLVEKKSIGIGTIYAAWFEHMGKGYYAFRYRQDSVMQYFDETGMSLRREFLKAPLEFRRISSHFSHSRLHPILRRYRPHHGVDYSAAPGTPVRTIGDGTVTDARYAGGAGKMIKVRHNSVYTTVYMHLRAFGPGIRAGSRVKQGDVIGYVGSTGLSTGPHLDFRVYKNGTPINPLKLESPPAEPVHPERLEQYKKTIAAPRNQLDGMKAGQ